jgi:two-component system chemotaxis response regulator CheB
VLGVNPTIRMSDLRWRTALPTNCVIVIGASAGGVEALRKLFRDLPPDLPASIFVVLHLSPLNPSMLPQILQKGTVLPVTQPEGGESIEPGVVYVAPPNRHLVVEDGTVQLTTAPRENRHRPAVDPLFRSAALFYGPRVIGVILSGSLDDGTAGLWEIKRRGGIAVVQDPKEAIHSGMPCSALANVEVDHVVRLSEMAELRKSLCDTEVRHEK